MGRRLSILTALIMIALCVHGKAKVHKTKAARKTDIGLHTGISASTASFKTTTKLNTSISTGFIVRQPVIGNLKIEGGVFLNDNIVHNKSGYKTNVTLPVTVQYYLRPDSKKIKPYIGCGTQITPWQQPDKLQSGDVIHPASNGTKYVTILFTQGVIFQVNTHIEISESIHICPEKDNTTFGINTSVGFRLP